MGQKTGADAIYHDIYLACNTIRSYQSKLLVFIASAQAASIISPSDAAVAVAFVTTIDSLCLIWQKLAEFNSV